MVVVPPVADVLSMTPELIKAELVEPKRHRQKDHSPRRPDDRAIPAESHGGRSAGQARRRADDADRDRGADGCGWAFGGE